jgi:hypothetical protein
LLAQGVRVELPAHTVLFDEITQLRDELLGDHIIDLWNIGVPLAVLKTKSVAGRRTQIKAKTSLVDRVVHVGDLVLKEPEVQQLCSLESTEAVKREIVVGGASNPAFAKGIDQVGTAQGFVDIG